MGVFPERRLDFLSHLSKVGIRGPTMGNIKGKSMKVENIKLKKYHV